MSDLISRSELIKLFKEHMRTARDFREIIVNIIPTIKNQPAAYDIDKVVEELEKIREKKTCNKEKCDAKEICRICVVDDAIEIVKQGGLSNRKDCEYRHENGNCLKVGGFCTSVDNKYCEKIKQGGVSDDVCEWKSASDGEFIQNPHTKRLYSNEPSMQNVYCNTCGKKIKVVE